MRCTSVESDLEVALEPAVPATSTVILLHGLGADGWDFVPIVDELRLPEAVPVRFVFLHAPLRPVTVNACYVMRAWYDIKSFTPEGRADAAGLAESVQRVNRYLEAEIARGIAASRIVLAGFSQGGAVALSTALRFRERLAGVLALSSYLPFPARLAAEKSHANEDVPILMCHGRMDPVVPIAMGIEARDVQRYFARQILTLFAEQKPTESHGLAQPARVAPGKNTLFLPALLVPKTSRPHAAQAGSLDELIGHSITYQIAVGRRAGQKVFTLQIVPAQSTREARTHGPLRQPPSSGCGSDCNNKSPVRVIPSSARGD